MSATDDGVDGESRTITVLEFSLGSQRLCMHIDHVVEIVPTGTVTPVPNAASHVEGVMDLRGETTTVVDPAKLLDFESDGSQEKVVVLDDEDEAVGWLVDDVHRVRRFSTGELDDSVGSGRVNGVFADEEHVVWIEPDGDFGT